VSIFSLLTGAAVKIQYLRRKEKYALFTRHLADFRKKQPGKPQIINVNDVKNIFEKFFCYTILLNSLRKRLMILFSSREM
jgi:hypothetical protein